jgi:pyruvate/2-oxoglutarate dehydrogenase complex dihydrolipoamide dehydrogenase (E3) component
MPRSYDAIVIGAGPAGEVAASRLHAEGMRTALVERELVGGECAYWACIPSKTLLRPAELRFEARRVAGTSEPEQRWRDIAEYRDFMIRNLDDSKQVSDYREEGVDVHKGEGRIVAERTVEVAGESLSAERIILANGSDPHIPDVKGLEQAGYWTNREATTLTEIPASVIVLGGGPVGIELGQFLNRFGARVTIVHHDARLLTREAPRVSELLADALSGEGIDVRLSTEATAASRTEGKRSVTLAGGEIVSADELLVATGRSPRSGNDVGLQAAGIQADPRGIKVDERCRAGVGVWAIGDVTGVMTFTHVAKYQARVACADIFGAPARADYSAIPRVVFCDPEIAAVGLTEEDAREQGIDVASASVALADAIARPWTYEQDPRGELGVIADRKRKVLIGAWAVSPLAGEWIHYAALAIKMQAPLAVLRDTVAQFPTYSEGYLKAIEALEI